MRRGAPSMTTSSRKLLSRGIIRDEASGKIIFSGGMAFRECNIFPEAVIQGHHL